MFEFVCDHLVPGCTHQDKDESENELRERAAAHYREHHSLNHFNEPIDEVLRHTGINFIRPA
jgi:predicted small metal-binding protein